MRSHTRALATATVTVALSLVLAGHHPTPVSAQAKAAPAEIPKLTGIWHRKGPMNGKNAPMSPTNRARGFEEAFDIHMQPTFDCAPMPIPAVTNDNYDFQITQQADRVIIRYEKMDVVRTVWLEGHGHPKPTHYAYTIQGHSTGRYDGPRLVIETTKFTFDPRAFNSNRFIPGSTMRKVTERFWREGDILKMESTSEDPLTLKVPYQYNFEYSLRKEPLTAYDCEPEDSRYGAQFHKSKYPADK